MMNKRKEYAGPKTRVNIVSVLNTEGAHTETLNGRQVMVVQSATLPDDVVMNDILYPAEEIRWAYPTLNRTPAPLGHPMIGGKFVSASDPEGLNLSYIGAFNNNAEQRDGRVFLDKIIDIEVAKQSAGGKKVLSLIEKGAPIHTSTGALLSLEEVEHDDYRFIARNIYFDHDAILINEKGAATPEQGVGMMVNKSEKAICDGEEIAVINSSVVAHLGDDIDWSKPENETSHSIIRNLARVLASFVNPAGNPAPFKECLMHDENKEISALSKKVEDLESGITEAITNAVKAAIEPLAKSIEGIEAVANATANVEKAKHVEAIVAAKLMTQEEADASTLASLKAIVNASKAAKSAAPIFGGGAPNGEDKIDFWANYDLNSVGQESTAKGDK